jgi:hypothetical protein
MKVLGLQVAKKRHNSEKCRTDKDGERNRIVSRVSERKNRC